MPTRPVESVIATDIAEVYAKLFMTAERLGNLGSLEKWVPEVVVEKHKLLSAVGGMQQRLEEIARDNLNVDEETFSREIDLAIEKEVRSNLQ